MWWKGGSKSFWGSCSLLVRWVSDGRGGDVRIAEGVCMSELCGYQDCMIVDEIVQNCSMLYVSRGKKVGYGYVTAKES